jgi:predicted aminopeptidase
MRMDKRTGVLLLAAAALLVFSSCSNEVGYYAQCVRGHADILVKRQPIAKVLANPAASPELKEKLALVLRIRDFASRELLLPDNGSYRCYADLQRSQVVWNVVAAPEFSLRPRQWCFPVAGCVTYRGYYSRDGAQTLFEKLQAQGDDVHLYGVDAYSTLGWFDDPVLNTFIDKPEARLAALIFHELAHQQVYIKGDSAFNEAFAEAVAEEGVVRWLRHAGRADALAGWQASLRRDEQFVALLREARSRLEKIYAAESDVAEKRAGKAQVFHELALAYVRLKESWGGHAGYDRWFASPLNNARLASVGTYRGQLPAFQVLLRQEGGDLAAFYRTASALGRLPADERHGRLRDLAASAGSSPGPDIASLWDAPPEG